MLHARGLINFWWNLDESSVSPKTMSDTGAYNGNIYLVAEQMWLAHLGHQPVPADSSIYEIICPPSIVLEFLPCRTFWLSACIHTYILIVGAHLRNLTIKPIDFLLTDICKSSHWHWSLINVDIWYIISLIFLYGYCSVNIIPRPHVHTFQSPVKYGCVLASYHEISIRWIYLLRNQAWKCENPVRANLLVL